MQPYDPIEFSLKAPGPGWTPDNCTNLPQYLVLAIAQKTRACAFLTGVNEAGDLIGLIAPGHPQAVVPYSALVDIVVLESVEFADGGGHTYKIAKPVVDSNLRVILRDSQECHLLSAEAVAALHAA